MDFKIHIGTTADLAGLQATTREINATSAAARRANQSAGGGFLSSLKTGLGEIARAVPGGNAAVALLDKFGGKLGAVAAGLWAAKKGLEEYAQAEAAVAGLDAALAQTGQLNDPFREKLQARASELQRLTAIADDQWFPVMQRLIQFGANESNIDQYLDSVKNLAGLMNGDVQGAAQVFSRAIQGNYEVFSRYGIKVEEAGTQTERLDKLMEQLARRGGGQLEARANTLSGQWSLLKANVGDVFEAFGRGIASTGILQSVLAGLARTAGFLSDMFGGPIQKMRGLKNASEATTMSLEGVGDAAQSAAQKATAAAEALEKKFSKAADAIDRTRASLDALTDSKVALEVAKIDQEEADIKERRPLTRREQADFATRRARVRGLGEQDKAQRAREAAEEKLQLANQRLAEEQSNVKGAETAVSYAGVGVKLAAQGAGVSESIMRTQGAAALRKRAGEALAEQQAAEQRREGHIERLDTDAGVAGMKFALTDSAADRTRKVADARAKRMGEIEAAFKGEQARTQRIIDLNTGLADALEQEVDAKRKLEEARKKLAEVEPGLQAAVTQAGQAAEAARNNEEAARINQTAIPSNVKSRRGPPPQLPKPAPPQYPRPVREPNFGPETDQSGTSSGASPAQFTPPPKPPPALTAIPGGQGEKSLARAIASGRGDASNSDTNRHLANITKQLNQLNQRVDRPLETKIV